MTLAEKLEIQQSIAKKCKNQCSSINTKLRTLAQVMEKLNAALSIGSEKTFLFSRLNTCGIKIAAIGNTYDAFADNLLQLSESMKRMLTYVGIMDGKNPIKCKSTTCSNSTKNTTKIKMNIDTVRDCANQIVSIGAELYDITLSLGSSINNVDMTLLKAMENKYGTIKQLDKQLDTYSNGVKAVGQDLLTICTNYEQTEKKLKSRLGEITKGKNLVYGDGVISEETKKAREAAGWAIGGTTLGKVTYSIQKEKGGLANTNIKGAQQIKEWMQKRNNNLPNKSAYANGLCTKYTLDKLRANGINVQTQTPNGGNGNQWYNNIKTGQTTTPKGYSVDCVDGNNAIQALIDKADKEPIYNIVVSFKHAWRRYSNTPEKYDSCGHVLMIDAIIDGKVYYSDNYNNKATVKDLSEFLSDYRTHYGNVLGAAHFVAND